MALVPQDLANALKAATEGATDPAVANSSIGTAITTYIKDNAEFTFDWTGTNTAPPYDTETQTPTGEFTTLTITMSPTGASSQSSWISSTKLQYESGMSAGMYNITESGYSTSPGPMSSSPTITSLDLSLSGSSRDAVLLQWATKIVDWVKAQAPTAPCAGTHGSYSGQGIVSTIS